MENIKIRYTWKRGSDGNIVQRIVDLKSLEEKGLVVDFSAYRLIAKDLFTGLKDKNNVDIYANDVLIGLRGYMSGDGYLRKGFPKTVRIYLKVVCGDGRSWPCGFHLEDMDYHPEDKKYTEVSQYRSILYHLEESRECHLNADNSIPWLDKNTSLQHIGNVHINNQSQES